MPDTVITYDELKEHTSRDNLYVLLHNKVYGVAKFIDEHPGGDEVLLAEAGKDATEAFEDVGHSDEARSLLEGFYVGDFEKDSALKTKDIPSRVAQTKDYQSGNTGNGSLLSYLLPLAVLGAYFAWRFYS